MKISLVDSKNSTICCISSKKFDDANIHNMVEIVNEWKNSKEAKENYKVEMYNRILFYEDHMLIDFGDYSTFIRIDVDAKEYAEFKKLICKDN